MYLRARDIHPEVGKPGLGGQKRHQHILLGHPHFKGHEEVDLYLDEGRPDRGEARSKRAEEVGPEDELEGMLILDLGD